MVFIFLLLTSLLLTFLLFLLEKKTSRQYSLSLVVLLVDFNDKAPFLCTSESVSTSEAALKGIDCRSFKLEVYCREFSWLYYDPVEQGFKCKMCELFATTGHSQAKFKFGHKALKSLGVHPRQTLKVHAELQKHTKAVKDYEGNIH